MVLKFDSSIKNENVGIDVKEKFGDRIILGYIKYFVCLIF